MTNFIAIISLIAQLMPQLITLIKAVEAVFPASGQGSNKLAIVRTALEASYARFTDAKVEFGEAWPAIEKVIGTIVTTYNASGIFKK